MPTIAISLYRNSDDLRQGLQFDVAAVLGRLRDTFEAIHFEEEYYWAQMNLIREIFSPPEGAGASRIAKKDAEEQGPCFRFMVLDASGRTRLTGAVKRYRLSFSFDGTTDPALVEKATAFMDSFSLPRDDEPDAAPFDFFFRKQTVSPVQSVRSAIGRGRKEDGYIINLLDGKPDIEDSFRRTPLHHAALWGRTDLVDALLKMGADKNRQDQNGMTALHFAVQESHCEAARVLLEAGAAVDLKDIHGNTPLGGAVREAKLAPELVKLLLKFGADGDTKNNAGISPRDLAGRYNDPGIMALFS